jgi:hypothetical protein
MLTYHMRLIKWPLSDKEEDDWEEEETEDKAEQLDMMEQEWHQEIIRNEKTSKTEGRQEREE